MPSSSLNRVWLVVIAFFLLCTAACTASRFFQGILKVKQSLEMTCAPANLFVVAQLGITVICRHIKFSMSGINRKVFLPSFLRYAVYQEQTCCFSVSSFIWFSSSSGLNKVTLQSKMVHDHLTYSVWASLEDSVTEMKVYCMERSMQPAIMAFSGMQRPAYEIIHDKNLVYLESCNVCYLCFPCE